MLMPLDSVANQQLSIGETETVYLNPSLPSGAWITSAGWSTDVVGLNYFDAGTWGTGIVADGYWPGTATLSCFYSYSYYGSDGNIHVGSGNEYWYFTCKGFPVTLTPTDVRLDKGESAELKFSIQGAKIGKIPPVWESSDKSVASVYSTGDYTATVTARSPGSCLITCYSYMGEPVYCNVTVNSFPPTKISLSPDEAEVTEGKSVSLKCIFYPTGASAKLKWESGNTSVATVENGRVKGISAGKTRITVTTDNGLTAYSDITVIGKFRNPRGPVSTSLTGKGTEDSPYLINSSADLRYLADQVNSGNSYDGKYFKQTSDIVINSGRFDSEDFKNHEIWIPIGNTDNAFKGIYDGDEHLISGLYLSNRENIYKSFYGLGLFGHISSKASIKNISVDNILLDVKDETKNFMGGGIIGCASQVLDVTVLNCHSINGKISGNAYVAGIVADATAKNNSIKKKIHVSKCSNSATLEGTYASGIIYSIRYIPSTIDNCINCGSVSTDIFAAGIVGICQTSEIFNCCNAGDVTSKGSSVSGINTRCLTDVTIRNCANYGIISSGKPEHLGAIYADHNDKNRKDVFLKDNYYISGIPLTAMENIKQDVNNQALTKSEMKSSATLKALNSVDDPSYCKWVHGSTGYPVLDFYAKLCSGVESITSDGNEKVNKYYDIPDNGIIHVFSITGTNIYTGLKQTLPAIEHGIYIVAYKNNIFKVIL